MKDDGVFIRYYQDRYRPHRHEHHRYFLDEKIKESVPQPLPEKVSFNLVLNTIGTPISASNITVQEVNRHEKITSSNITLQPQVTDNKNDIIHSGQVIVQLPATNDAATHIALPTIKTHLVNVNLPTASLYQINPTAPKGYIVETDSKFTDSKNWLSSDYLFNQLNDNHDKVQKRLGDGYYEQRLINEQINQLTGRRYLNGFNSDIEQYKALMNAGVKYAKDFNLAVGVGLTAKQMSELTSDMVWLVNKEITLENGEKITALVPQVYLVAGNTDIDSHGAVISANNILANVDELQNTGTIAGRDLTHIQSNHLKNQGVILGDSVDLSANQTLINLGGKIEAVSHLNLYAGKELEIASTTNSAESNNPNFASTVLDQQSHVKVTGTGGQLNLLSGGNLTVKAAQLESNGTIYANAQNGLTITTLNTENKEHYNADDNNYYLLDQQGEIGTSIKAKENITLIGKAQADVKQAEIHSEQGDVVIGSLGEVNINAGRQQEQVASAIKTSHKGLLSKTTEITRHNHHISQVEASNISGENIKVFSGNQSVNIKGSNVVANQSLQIQAKENVDIAAEQNSYYEENYQQKTKTGLMGSGGIGFTIGKRQSTLQDKLGRTTQSDARSTIGSLNGDISIQAGNQAKVLGADLIVNRENNREIDITAKQIKVEAGKDIITHGERQEYKQSGLTLSLSSGLVDGAKSLASTVKRSEQVNDPKLNALLKVKAANEAIEVSQKIGKLKATLDSLQKASNVSEASDMKLSLNVGSNQSVFSSQTEQTTHQASELSGGKVNLNADQNIAIIGSEINAQTANLTAENINLTASTDSQSNRSDNKNSGWKVGVFVGVSGGAKGIGVEGSVNVGKGHANSDSKQQYNTHINAENVNLHATENTTLKGAVVNANNLKLSTKNLEIESLQDSEKYHSKQTQASAGGAFAIYGSGSSAYAQASQTKANIDYAQVTEQSGIHVKDSSNITVQDNTHLKGGIIAVENNTGNHHFSTGTLTTEDIKNHSEIDISTVSAGASTDSNQMAMMAAMSAAMTALGNQSENEQSLTKSAISQNIQVSITDDQAQQQKTGKTAKETTALLNRDTEHANEQVEKQDLTKLEERQEIVKTIGEISQQWLNFAVQDKLDEANQKRQQAESLEKTNPEQATQLRKQANDIENQYGIGSDLQMGVRAATAVIQGLAGHNVNQAIVGGLSPYLNQEIKQQTGDNTTANLIAHSVLGALEAQLTRQNAIAGATAALTAEAAAPVIMKTLYGTTDKTQLNEQQRQTIVNLSQITAGISGGLIADSTAGVVNGAEIGKRAVENNFNIERVIQDHDYALNLANVYSSKEQVQNIENKVLNDMAENPKEVAVFLLDEYSPHYVSGWVGAYKYSGKFAVNLRNFDIFVGESLSIVNGANPSLGGGIEFGRVINLNDNDKNNLGYSISNILMGTSIGANACYTIYCGSISSTLPINKNRDTYQTLGVGLGGGYSLGIDNLHKINWNEHE